jgi:chromosome partitioning protein
MNAPIIAFFNPQGGIGTTSLVYHLAWMYQGLGLKVLAIDLDPQASLTAMLLEENRLAEIWEEDDKPNTVAKCLQPLMNGIGAVADPVLELIEDGFYLLSGDLSLSKLEDHLSLAWFRCLESSFSLNNHTANSCSLISAFWKLIQKSNDIYNADMILLDLGPNLGAVNRSILLAADHLITPLSLDFFSLQGLKQLRSTLIHWQIEWQKQVDKNLFPATILPKGNPNLVGYVIQQHSILLDRPGFDYNSWITKARKIYNNNGVISNQIAAPIRSTDDPNCLAILKNYQNLVPMALAARKAVFQLKPADGAIGAYSQAVREVSEDFRQLAQKIARLTQIENWPESANYTHNYRSIPEYKNPPRELPLYVLEQGLSLFRIHSSAYGAMHFDRSNRSRFASPAGDYGVLYTALDYYIAFRETLQPRDFRLISGEVLQRMCLSQLYLKRDLRLVDLSGAGLVKIGADARIVTGSYQLAQSWSQTLYEHPDRVDGIYYRSRYDPSRCCVVLYENRVAPSDLRAQRVTEHNLLDRSFASDLQQILDNYGYQLDDDENLQG